VAGKAGLSNHAITTLANGGIPEDLSDHAESDVGGVCQRVRGPGNDRRRSSDRPVQRLPSAVDLSVELIIGTPDGAHCDDHHFAYPRRKRRVGRLGSLELRQLRRHLGVEKIAARLARELSTRHRVEDALYRKAEQAFGRTGLFDIVALMGLYHTVCTVLTLIEVPAPTTLAGLVGQARREASHSDDSSRFLQPAKVVLQVASGVTALPDRSGLGSTRSSSRSSAIPLAWRCCCATGLSKRNF
jgi:hypothetical protein